MHDPHIATPGMDMNPTSDGALPETTSNPPAELPARLRAIRDGLNQGLVERDLAVRLALLAALAGEHLLMVGPPGTAKSLIARRLRHAFADATYFERLLTRFTVPEELFGPLSIRGLEEDRYERLTGGYLPSASIAFLDEIFKGNSAILNTLLTLLNEREFDNGATRDRTPLIAVIGASNELPEGEELDALFDRFLLRLHVGPVTQEAFPALIGLRGQGGLPKPSELPELTDDDLRAVQEAAERVEVPDDIVSLLCALRDWCLAEGLEVSDRRWRKVLKLLQVSAATNGRMRVSTWDCWLLQHCLWRTPEDREKIHAWYAARVGASAAMDPSRLTRIVVAHEAQLVQDQSGRSQAIDDAGRPLYEDSAGARTPEPRGRRQATRRSMPLYLAPPGAQAPRRSGYGHELAQRTNDGKGYMVEELNHMLVPHGHSVVNFHHWSEREAYLKDEANWHMEAFERPVLLEPTRHKGVYIASQIATIESLKKDVVRYRSRLCDHIASLDAEIRGHLWVTEDFAKPAAQHLEASRVEVDRLLKRIDKLKGGYDRLPREAKRARSRKERLLGGLPRGAQ